MSPMVLLVLILVESVYLIAGGFIFWSLESDRELTFKAQKRNFNLTALLAGFIDVHTSVSMENLTDFIAQILENERKGLLQEQEISNWDIHGSLFFAMTVVTTIGYGNVTPATTGGQLFCCLFAIVGIPLTMVALIGIGDLLKKLVAKINRKFFPARFHDNKLVNTVVITVVGVILFLLVPAAIFTKLENWNYGSALYFGVITTTTVGFGDYVAAWSCEGDPCWIYIISVGIWIFLGLAWLAGVIGTIQEGLQSLISKIIARCKRKLSKKVEENKCKEEEGERSETKENTASDPVELESISTETLDADSKCNCDRPSRDTTCRNIASST